MVLTSSQTTLAAAAAAVVISAASSSGSRMLVIANAGTNLMHIGPSGVTASTGLPIAAGASVTINVPTDVAIYGFSTAGSTAAVLTFS